MLKRTPLKRSHAPIPRKRLKPRRGPLKDPAYLEWIRQQPCCIRHFRTMNRAFDPSDWRHATVEAAHVGMRGLGQKCSDREAIPLCSWHHGVGTESAHVRGKRFWDDHLVDRQTLIAAYNQRYHEETGL